MNESFFSREDLIKKMADCEWLYFSFIFRIIFGVLALIIIAIILMIPIVASISLIIVCEAKFSLGSIVCNILFYLLVYFYFDFVKNAFVKTAGFFFVLHC